MLKKQRKFPKFLYFATLRNQMMTNDDKKKAEKAGSFFCEKCDYTTSYVSKWKRHVMTPKHQNDDKMMTKKAEKAEKAGKFMTEKYNCNNCNNIYCSRQGLSLHKKKCKNKMPDISGLTTLIIDVINQNKELTKQVAELTTPGNNNSNNIINSNNKTFNLHFFLNETCKNAMNISDFVSMIQPKIENLEETGRLGYVTGISNLILTQLNEMELDNRPVHCRDLKREVLYVKDKDEWNKETSETPILSNAIKTVANKNIKTISEWQDKHPDCSDYHSKYNKEYLKIVSNAMAGSSFEEINKNTGKIVSNIAKEVFIDK